MTDPALRATSSQDGDPVSVVPFSAQPSDQGLYRRAHEHDACGVAMVATMRGTAGHDIVVHALDALRNLDHRGATGADPLVGDGAGILTQIPDEFLRAAVPFALPPAGRYAAGMAYLPQDRAARFAALERVERIAREEGLVTLGWREVPVTESIVGQAARETMPFFAQLFVAAADGDLAGLELDRVAFALRKRAERELDVYFPSLSARTIVYKGMLTTGQLEPFFPDLSDQRFTTELALVHSRFSTNTFPSWPLAHPYRLIAHNGEINTVKGNRNWMHARENQLSSDLIGGDLQRLFPICTPEASDSASFDEVLELIHLGGRSLPHAVLMMIPEAWENHATMDPARRAFYEFHSTFMEPWDGPACVTFTDGTLVGAVLDRNGLRPGRYWVTDDGLVVLASESGVLDLPAEKVVKRGRLQPGRMFLVDTADGRIISDEEVKSQLAAEQPYEEWLHAGLLHLGDLPDREHIQHTAASVARRQRTFGYTEEELKIILAPMARTGGEALGSMGTDTPIAVLSDKPRLLFDYFTQQFAQVTNPPLDAIREELVTSLGTSIGPEGNLLDATPAHVRQVVLDFPVLDNDELAKIVHINADGDLPGYATAVVQGLYDANGGEAALKARLDEICTEVSAAIDEGARFVVLSDRDSDRDLAPIPSLLLTSAVHHHLIREKTRNLVGLIVEAGDVREVHHVALLIGYGAAAVNPYLAMESVEDLVRSGAVTGVTQEKAVRNLIKALGKGVLKVMSKMGISTVASYRGAQVFEAIGLSQELVDRYFTGTVSQLGGVGLDVIAEETAARHAAAYPPDGVRPAHRKLGVGGEYQWRREGEPHLFDPETVFRLQHATRNRRYDIFKQYTRRIDEQAGRLMTLRGLMELRPKREPIAIEEVEPISEIVKRFNTGAMSYGSISMEAHETLAIAMNRLGGRSNTGEGGEDVERLLDPQRRSAIKQVASGRFGVTINYLTNADELQIKMAQGAKPGEGGELPGRKVDEIIATVRHSTPGVGLISPPPHHDIYSIEDLAQLIYDLKNANPSARISVKLVSEVGVGTVAAGVAKAHADHILISGHDGGTGASPLTSIKHAGLPWELGVAETQQTLVLNDLRSRVVVQTDGQLKTGRDVVIAALLGAEEFGFSTGPLIVLGCIMMRKCHLNTCPVGIATQDPALRKKFTGQPEHVVNYLFMVAEDARRVMAKLGFRSIDEMIGRVDVLDTSDAVSHWKAQGIDLRPMLQPALPSGPDVSVHCVRKQDHGIEHALDNRLIELARPAIERGERVEAAMPIRNVHRTVGTMLSHEIAKAWGETLLDEGTVHFKFEGSAGQSFGAWLARGVELELEGDANDYVGKGLSGGQIVVYPPKSSTFASEENIVVGNVVLYGAIKGKAFFRGRAAERFCVRNSGALAVVEGVGDHGCEYMTGGRVVVLGATGRNFAAGMSGGVAYVWDPAGEFPERCNPGMVELEGLVDADEQEAVQALIAEHRERTGSEVARRVLDTWEFAVRQFVKVMPTDYKRVLQARADAARAGADAERVQQGVA